MCLVKKHVMDSSLDMQLCAGSRLGSKAFIHSMRGLYEQEEAEAIILVDTTNAFNGINGKFLFHNIMMICPFVSSYRKKGTTQSVPSAMTIYSVSTKTRLNLLINLFVRKFTIKVSFTDVVTSG